MAAATTPHRLVARRSSTSASDPFGTRSTPNPSLQTSSTLTIVRVPSTPSSPQPDATPAPSSSPRRLHRRLPSQPSSGQEGQNRLSFAFSSFASGSSPGGPANTSPSSSPRLRPSSPHGPSSPHRISTQLPPSNPRLSPEQLLEIAKSSTNPRQFPQNAHHTYSPSNSPQLRAQSPSIINRDNITPATFTPLPDHILLPFIDRPSEVASLISSPPSAKLFSLLAQTFPQGTPTHTSSEPTLPLDSTQWTYKQLHTHLTQATRRDFPDFIWVLQARKCIMYHSELIWERIKGALGVPPELDVDYSDVLSTQEFDFPSALSTSSIDTDELSDDHGRAARGHWEDWDAIMDSPIFDRRHPFSHTPPAQPSSATKHDTGYFNDAGDAIPAPSPRSDIVSPTSFLSIEPLLASSATSPAHSVMSPPNSMSLHGNLATSEITGLGLDDIQEGAEEEEDPASASSARTTEEKRTHPSSARGEQLDPDMILPSQIQGLRISTTPIAVSELASGTPSPSLLGPTSLSSTSLAASGSSVDVVPSPVSPLPPYPSFVPSLGARSRPTSGTFQRPHMNSNSYNYPSVFRRSGSSGSLPPMRSDREQVQGHPHGHGHREDTGEDTSSESGYQSIGDRAPGSPLFPSNFTKLNLEPTLGGDHGSRIGPKRRAFSHGAGISASSTDRYKRQSWGAAPTSTANKGP